MVLSYRSRLRREMDRWVEKGMIDPDLRQRLEAEAFSASGFAHLQSVLMLCAVILAGVGLIAFVAANWAGLEAVARMAILIGANGIAVLVAFVAFERHRARPDQGSWVLAEGAATLSVVAAAASVALVAQTFHLPSDTRSFATTVAFLAALTAFVARSGGCAMVAAVALIVANTPDIDLVGRAGAQGGASLPLVTLTWTLLLGCASGWVAARTSTFLLILLSLCAQMGAYGTSTFLVRYDIALTLAAAVIGVSHAASAFVPERFRVAVQDRLELLARAAAGLALLGIAALSLSTVGGGWVRTQAWRPSALLWDALRLLAALAAPYLLFLPRKLGRGGVPAGHLLVLLACAVPLCLGWLRGSALGSSFTVWVGLVPLLVLAVAGHLDERRALFAWSMTLVAALAVGMLYSSRDLMSFAMHLLGSAGLALAAFAACRWADRNLRWRLA
jgi:uncharacterized membrane protein